jgi:hypothetical protein
MRSFVRTFLLIALPVSLSAQDQTIEPWSWKLGLSHDEVPSLQASAFDELAAQLDDDRRAAEGELPLYGRFVNVTADINSAGHWTTLANGDRIWRLQLISDGAIGVDPFFEEFHLPPGALFHVYDPDRTQMHGAYKDRDVQAHGYFVTPMIIGNSFIVEYFEPFAVRGEGYFRIKEMGHAYRYVPEVQPKMSDTCEVDVNCSEGSGWEAQRDASVRIRVVDPSGTGWCSGAVMNNTTQNCAPYILTALHCGVSSTTANFNQYIFRFNYQRAGCDAGQIMQGSDRTGCIKRASSQDNGGDNGSDFLLVELNTPISSELGTYFAGWNANNVGAQNGRGIHHPNGDRKKISTFTSTLQTGGWGINGTHWRVVWISTENGHGVTEGGSSGSPIFDQEKRVVGTLTGGGSFCNTPTAPDYYGKMSHHWTSNPNPSNQKLKEWLAPGSSVTVFDGAYCGTVGVEENSTSDRPEVYPNPSQDRFTVQYPYGVAQADLIEVTDLSGRVIYSERPSSMGKAMIDAGSWSSGTFLVSIVAKGVRHAGAKVTVEGR